MQRGGTQCSWSTTMHHVRCSHAAELLQHSIRSYEWVYDTTWQVKCCVDHCWCVHPFAILRKNALVP